MKNVLQKKNQGRARRKNRVRARIYGTAECPRLSVFRSLKHVSVQLINDDAQRTIAAASDHELKGKLKGVAAAQAVGELLAERAQAQKVTRVVFDRNGYRYHGQVRAIADGARAKGLQF